VTTASLHNTDLVKSLGATHIIDRKADVVAEAKKIFSEPPKIVYDAISLEPTEVQAVQIVAPGGTLIIVLPLADSAKALQADKQIFHIFGNAHAQRELGVSMYSKLTSYVESGKIKVSLRV